MRIQYTAQLKPTGKPIKIDSENCAEITYTAPGSEISEIIKHTMVFGKTLRITVEPEPDA